MRSNCRGAGQNRSFCFFAQIVEFDKSVFIGASAVHGKGDDLDTLQMGTREFSAIGVGRRPA